MPDLKDITDKVRSILVTSPVVEGLDPATIHNDTPLAESLGLDSVDALEIVAGLEQEFEITVDPAGLDRNNFHSIDALSLFIHQQITAASKEG